MVQFLRSALMKAHKHSKNNMKELEVSKQCGCFYCFEVYDPIEILDDEHSLWLDESTATCSKCGIDSVIGDASGYPVNDNLFLEVMGFVWFNGYSRGHDQYDNFHAINDKLSKYIIDDIPE
jgi:hypothetical protein